MPQLSRYFSGSDQASGDLAPHVRLLRIPAPVGVDFLGSLDDDQCGRPAQEVSRQLLGFLAAVQRSQAQ